ncbi:MAG TPA: PqiC family protein, partial [Vicinamibacteria bacterium]|nr:PqiC family protein [Vicinamibacteria bacterium]
MRTRLVVIACGVVALAVAGCVSLKRTPEARFFVLRALVVPPEAAVAAARPGSVVGILPVRVPGHLERPQLVTWAGPGELRIEEYLRWAEPIDAGIARTLAENLDALLPAHPVIRSPWPAAVTPFCRVRVDLRVFGLQENGDVRLEGR